MGEHTMENVMDTVISTSFLAAPPPQVAERIRKQPECRLLWAVLQEGVETYMKYATATSRRGKRLFREAEDWIMQDDPTWLCSFVSICHILGLDPGYVRLGLRRWRAGLDLANVKGVAYKEAA
ncbi:MAG: hypothetical protein NZ578_09225 [Candidatus Binatia bacterium]|nr:hypothetical protein [Candidatus Binatia bacterium]